MIYLKTDDEIELLRKANSIVAGTLAEIAKIVKPGVSTRQLDTLAEQYIRDNGAVPTFKGFPNPYGPSFPASICTSVNDVIVHGEFERNDMVEYRVGGLWHSYRRLQWCLLLYVLRWRGV